MKKAVIIAALLGCGTSALAASVPVVDVSDPVARNQSSGDLSSRVARLEQLLRANSQAQLRLEQTVEQMQRELGELRGTSETTNYQIEQMLERQRQLYQQIAKLKSSPTATAKSETTKAATSASSITLSEADSYANALNLATKERRFDDAIPAFQSFIKQYPKSSYVPNAYYWLGQLLYNKGDLAEANKMFANVINGYPKSGKRADSLLKQGLIAQRQGDTAAAKGLFDQVISQYPNTSAANLARKQIN